MTWDAVHDSRTAFSACMWALCSPGTPIELSCAPAVCEHAELDRAAAVLLALLDRGLGLGVSGGDAAHRVADTVRAQTGANAADLDTADWVLVHGPAATAITQARRGTRLTPETGATLVIATAGEARPLLLSGPGLPCPTKSFIPIDALALHALTAANANPPTGVDVLIVTPECLIGLPRSVTIQAVA
ncbi:phosphonate C-P lyase system protein PhnH [Mycobacterium sp. NAZ190054]|uniref:phosphonate C-P lyase system protein PhnH n=1 Tax=Mycobacterium sp. NAZ190054 TaxID=1747766 RepID=UPI000795AECB|nr:phosphonate C-P lyase system protein PhnH [Mycobacterium sp. NAZ190054]KWX68424.1 phosphonate C-P lyase [Mycobacterium sp. NAZ190054]